MGKIIHILADPALHKKRAKKRLKRATERNKQTNHTPLRFQILIPLRSTDSSTLHLRYDAISLLYLQG
jgi:hypothetical protein